MPTDSPFSLLYDAKHELACDQLASELGFSLITSAAASSSRFFLCFEPSGRLGLTDSHNKQAKPYIAELHVRRQSQGIDPLMRAIGYRTGAVLDCTGGWATDAAHIAAHGIPVIAIERHPVVYALVRNALAFCENEKIIRNLSWRHENSVAFLDTLDDPIDVIYLDPMYPPRPGSAAPKKPLQLLQSLIAEDKDDAGALLSIALTKASQRVVVKRPHYAAPLLPGKSGATEGKLVRYDIYPASHES